MGGTCSPHREDYKYIELGNFVYTAENNIKMNHGKYMRVWSGFIWLRTMSSA
jgi:hypothetical protein